MSAIARSVPVGEEAAAAFRWRFEPGPSTVLAALNADVSSRARFVGGCVRDSLYGERPKDIDFATRDHPSEVQRLLERAGIGVAATGLAHGTLTAVVNHVGYEVTTLRADVKTDGRRATVSFTDDWETDARRRDFTINALYLDADGLIHDFVGGLTDVEARRVRFIGDARRRIREDFLRILRFFRFSARFADAFDAEGMRAAEALREGLRALSAERIGMELERIFVLRRADAALTAMADASLWTELADSPPALGVTRRLLAGDRDASAPLVAAALFGDAAPAAATRWRWANARRDEAARAHQIAASLRTPLSAGLVRTLIYRYHGAGLIDGARLAAARRTISDDERREAIAIAENWSAPDFPFRGRDVLAAGVAPGEAVSQMLEEAETRWIAADFPDDARPFLDAAIKRWRRESD